MDIVSKYKDFLLLSIDEQLEIKRIGRPTPMLCIKTPAQSRGKNYDRKFNANIYSKIRWICGCEVYDRLFCFVCLLFGHQSDSQWTKSGVSDIVHLSDKAKFHEISKQHLTNEMRFYLLGKTNIEEQLNSTYWQNISIHNKKFVEYRLILSKIVDAILFCEMFELAFKGLDESDNSENHESVKGLINYTVELDKTLKKYLQSVIPLKGTSEDIQNDLLESIFEVYREIIATEIGSSEFLGVIAEEATSISSQPQTAIVFRYIKDGMPVERFWGIFPMTQQTAEALSSLLLTELDLVIGKNPNKLIAQSYDGAAIISEIGVQVTIKQIYPLAYFVHCHAHKLNTIMVQAASQNDAVRLFFGNLFEISAFFSNFTQSIGFLNKVVKCKIPTAPIKWNFKSRTVNIVHKYREEIIECLEEMEKSPIVSISIKTQAGAIVRLLQEKSFIFWLTFFHHIMPHIDILFSELQKRIRDSEEINNCLQEFKQHINMIKYQGINDIMKEAKAVEVLESKRRKLNELNWKVSAIEICDVIIKVAEDRFECTEHLNAANLFICEKFEWYDLSFPYDYFKDALKCYPMLEKQRLKTELSLLYTCKEFRNFSSCGVLLSFFLENDLKDVFQETIKLLQILVIMPMTPVEAEGNFSTLKRIKTFLKTTTCEDRLNTLAYLTIERNFIRSISNFNKKVIDKFALKKTGALFLS